MINILLFLERISTFKLATVKWKIFCIIEIVASLNVLDMTQPPSVHIVGSVPFPSAEEVFIKSIQTLPERLHSIPDGETGSRYNFVMWQSFVFPTRVLGLIHR